MEKNKFPQITSPEIRSYCEKHSDKASDILNQLEKKSASTEKTKMLSGPFLGRFLSIISKIINPKNILEIGTFTGYGMLCLAEGMQSNGTLVSIEKNEALKGFYNEFLSEIRHDITITQHIGDAAEIIDSLDLTYDLVFIDAAKRQYIKYYEQILPKLNQGGVILADNVLWKGKVVTQDADKLGQGMMAFNEYILNDNRVENIILPIDDGVNLIRKK